LVTHIGIGGTGGGAGESSAGAKKNKLAANTVVTII
jgi:hypothetical protein